MPPKKREPKAPSVRSRIEKTLDIAKLEMGWYKGKKGELRPAAKERSKGGLLLLEANETDKSFIHTHNSKYGPIPSYVDLHTFLKRDLKKRNIRTWHFVSLDKNGYVTGYYSLHATKNLVKEILSDNDEVKNLLKKLTLMASVTSAIGGPYTPSQHRRRRELIQRLEKIGLRLHLKPMPGFIFKKGRFVKIRGLKPEPHIPFDFMKEP